MKQKTIELAECLKSVGVQKGDVIGLCSENRLEFPVPLFAAFCLGVTVAPLNLTYTEREYWIEWKISFRLCIAQLEINGLIRDYFIYWILLRPYRICVINLNWVLSLYIEVEVEIFTLFLFSYLLKSFVSSVLWTS